MRKQHETFLCDVCGHRFPVAAKEAADPVREILCPRCRTPFVHPVPSRRGGGALARLKTSRCLGFS